MTKILMQYLQKKKKAELSPPEVQKLIQQKFFRKDKLSKLQQKIFSLMKEKYMH